MKLHRKEHVIYFVIQIREIDGYLSALYKQMEGVQIRGRLVFLSLKK